MQESKMIDITKYVLDEKFWMATTPRKHYTGHMYYMSSFESDDDCGTCNGAKCDYCKEIIDKDNFDCAIPCNILENIIRIHFDLDDEIISELVYADSIDRRITKGYFIHWPTLDDLKEKYPGFYTELTNPDQIIWSDIAVLIANYSLINPIKNYLDFRQNMIELLSEIFYRPHLKNQLSMMRDIFDNLDREKCFTADGFLSKVGKSILSEKLMKQCKSE